MKTYLIAFMLLAFLQSNGQDTTKVVRTTVPHVSSRLGEWRRVDWYILMGTQSSHSNKIAAEVRSGSDTLFIHDSVIYFSPKTPIRFIKIKDKVYPLKP